MQLKEKLRKKDWVKKKTLLIILRFLQDRTAETIAQYFLKTSDAKRNR